MTATIPRAAGMPELTVDELVRRVGPLEDIRSGLDRFDRSGRAFSAAWPRLIKEYANQWVAVLDGDVVASADSREAVIEAVVEQGLPRSKLFVRYMSEKPRTLIL